jgi:hypothetical protein
VRPDAEKISKRASRILSIILRCLAKCDSQRHPGLLLPEAELDHRLHRDER